MRLLDFFIRIRLDGGHAAKQLAAIAARARGAKGGLNGIGAAAAAGGARMSGFAKRVNDLNAALGRLQRRSRIRFAVGGSIGGGMAAGMAGGLGATAAAGISSKGVSGAIEFEDAVNAAAVTAKMSAEQQSKYSEELLKVSERTGMLPSLLAELGT